MNRAKKKRLERKGWRIGNASDFLGLVASQARYMKQVGMTH